MQTNRIRIYPASREQMEQVLHAEEDEDLRKAYREMLEGCLSHPEQREWYAMWMIEKTDGTLLGDLCFKGIEDGRSPEIGYGIREAFRDRGTQPRRSGWHCSGRFSIRRYPPSKQRRIRTMPPRRGFFPSAVFSRPGSQGTKGPDLSCSGRKI